MGSNAGGISIVAFVIAVGISIGYYQYVYVPEVNAKPILPEEILDPSGTFNVEIVEGSSLESNSRFFVPRDARTTIEIDNRVVWTNNDTVPHTVTTDDGYVDQINGPFDSLQQQEIIPGGFLMPGDTFEFVFTEVGEYPYHCEPHPWMQGSVQVIENFA